MVCRKRSRKRSTKKGNTGGLCRWLAKKHRWPKAKLDKCISKSKRRRKHKRKR